MHRRARGSPRRGGVASVRVYDVHRGASERVAPPRHSDGRRLSTLIASLLIAGGLGAIAVRLRDAW